MSEVKKCPLSIAVIVKNEEKRLEDCLKSCEWADEIVILDDESTDRTLEIAKQFASTVHERKMDIEGRQRNHAYSLARNEWVLSLDADERITPELAKEITELLASNPTHNAFSIPIKTYLGRRWIKGSGYYPAKKVRLFRKDKFKYEEARVHPRIFLEGTCGELNGDILHYSWKNMGEFMTKFNRETSLEADKWIKDGRKVSLLNTLRKCTDRFLKFYLLKGGVSDGFPGFLMACFHSLYQLITYAKYHEQKMGWAIGDNEVGCGR